MSKPEPRKERPAAAGDPPNGPTALPPTLRRARIDVESIVAAVGDTTYRWDLRSDQIAWQANAAEVLGVASLQAISSGAGYHLLIGTEHAGARFDSVRGGKMRDSGDGVPYRLRYRILPDGRRGQRSHWVEDEGRWFAGPDGEPSAALGLIRRIDEQLAAEQRLLYLSERDQLTGLMNSSRLVAAIESALAEERATRKPFALLIASIDNLSRINEAFGFEVGNEVVRAASDSLRGELRSGDAVGRFSSNKFGFVIHDCDVGGLQAIARRLLEAVAGKAVATSVCRMAVTLSIGGVLCPRHGASVAEALGAALDALEEARARRGNAFVAYSPDDERTAGRRKNIAMSEAIIAALDQGRIRLALQPVVEAGSRRLAFSEALLRMEMPDGRIATAGEFMPVAEQLGLGRMLDVRALELAAAHLRRHAQARLSINLAGGTARDPNWIVALHRLTGEDRSLARRLIVEITETAALEDIEEYRGLVEALKTMGCRVAIDDFGAGYTSFKNLRDLGAQIVKIDGSFIRNLATGSTDLVFVEALVRLAGHFGMETVAEHVGDEATVAILRKAGVTYLQGNHLGAAALAQA